MYFDIRCGDALDVLGMLPDACLDLVVTDPAYESLEKHRRVGTTTRLKRWFPIFENTRFPRLFEELYRCMKEDTHLYLMCDADTMFVIKSMGEAAGFRFWKPLVWDKGSLGMGYHYRASYEFVLFFEKGKRKLHDLGIRDVLSFPRVRGGYPTQKPVELLKVLIEQSSEPEDLVLDCFLGSGATGEAALSLGRNFLGADLLETVCGDAKERLLRLTDAFFGLEMQERQRISSQLDMFFPTKTASS